MYPKNRKDAIKMGSKFYQTNEPCIHGHYSKRYTSSKGCFVCLRAKDKDTNARHQERLANNWLEEQFKRKNREYKRAYGISYIQYRNMCMIENYACAICEKPERFMDKEDWKKKGYLGSLVVDHCHDTQRVRGVLCNECNKALGVFKNKALIKKADEYLDRGNVCI